MMCGIVGSGKSTSAQKISDETGAIIFSSDELRKEMFGDVNEQNKNDELFRELHKRIKECLKSGNNAIYDATNISSKRRCSFVQELNKIECEKRCIVIATPIKECIARNNSRERKVPEEVINNMHYHWETPYLFEGWDNIQIIYPYKDNGTRSIENWLNVNRTYNQCNPHHSMSLARHCICVGEQLSDKNDAALYYAGLLHDVGKPITQTFTNSKGEHTEFAHYYCHENVGSYETLFFKCPNANILDVSVLVGLHMRPYNWERDNNEKLHNKYRKLWGENLYQRVMMLHEADKAAH